MIPIPIFEFFPPPSTGLPTSVIIAIVVGCIVLYVCGSAITTMGAADFSDRIKYLTAAFWPIAMFVWFGYWLRKAYYAICYNTTSELDIRIIRKAKHGTES